MRDVLAVPVIAPLLEPLEPHSIKQGGSVEGDMIARMSHGHPLSKADNSAVFKLIKNVVLGTVIATLIAPFCCTRDGCAAFMASGTNMQARMFGTSFTKRLRLSSRPRSGWALQM
jgi:hypothetical protein